MRGWYSRWRRAASRSWPVVSPDEGYRIWAGTYGSPPNAFQHLAEDALRRLLPPLEGLVALDLGCGTGRTARLARERGAAWVVGLDRSMPMLAAANRSSGDEAAWVAASVTELPLASSRFDVVICGLVLGHVAHLRAALEESARVLRPGGILLISDFHPYATLRGWQRTVTDPATGREYAIEQHLHLLSEYVTELARLGLTLEALDEPCHEGFPVVFVFRARKHAGPAR